MIYLVGAGPGDIGLMTVKGLECVKKADVIIYDRLINGSILDLARAGAELIYVGKSRGEHTRSQDYINRIIIEKAKKSKYVVRLKGGDPFLFGRGAEEAIELSKAGIAYKVVPGVSSALAASAYAGIPVTHRTVSSSVTIITGNEDPEKKESVIDWSKVIQNKSTLVILMGLKNIELIMDKLSKLGAGKKLPVAVIQNGTLPQQKVIIGNVGDIAGKVTKADLKPPAIIVVGEVVKLRRELQGVRAMPLKGKNILVTRPKEQTADFIKLLKEQGASVINKPLLRIIPIKDNKRTSLIIKNIDSYARIIVSSINGVDYLMKALSRNNVAKNRMRKVPFAAIGPKTAKRLERYGFYADIVPKEFRQEGLACKLANISSKGKALIVRSEEGRKYLKRELIAHGYAVEELSLYRSRPILTEKKKFKKMFMKGELDAVTLTSSSCVKAFRALFTVGETRRLLENVAIAVIGPVSADTARKYGIRVDIQAKEYTIEGLTKALAAYYS